MFRYSETLRTLNRDTLDMNSVTKVNNKEKFIKREIYIGEDRITYVDAGNGADIFTFENDSNIIGFDEILRDHRLVSIIASENDDVSIEIVAQVLDRLGVQNFALVAQGNMAGRALRLAAVRGRSVSALVLESPKLEDDVPVLDPAIPAVVLIGTRDPSFDEARRATLRAAIPHAYWVFVYDAGAQIRKDRPDAFTKVSSDFISRLDAFVVTGGSARSGI